MSSPTDRQSMSKRLREAQRQTSGVTSTTEFSLPIRDLDDHELELEADPELDRAIMIGAPLVLILGILVAMGLMLTGEGDPSEAVEAEAAASFVDFRQAQEEGLRQAVDIAVGARERMEREREGYQAEVPAESVAGMEILPVETCPSPDSPVTDCGATLFVILYDEAGDVVSADGSIVTTLTVQGSGQAERVATNLRAVQFVPRLLGRSDEGTLSGRAMELPSAGRRMGIQGPGGMRTPVSNPVFSISSVFDGRVRDRTTYRIPSDRTARAVREQQRQELQARRAAAETRREMGLLRSEAERRVELAREAAQADIAQERTRYRSPR